MDLSPRRHEQSLAGQEMVRRPVLAARMGGPHRVALGDSPETRILIPDQNDGFATPQDEAAKPGATSVAGEEQLASRCTGLGDKHHVTAGRGELVMNDSADGRTELAGHLPAREEFPSVVD